MMKLVCILRGSPGEPVELFRERVFGAFASYLMDAGPEGLKICVSAMDHPRLSLIPFGRGRIALVSIWYGRGTGREAGDWARDAAREWKGPASAYLVEESVPVAYARTWPAGEKTPGLGLLTIFNPRRGLSREDFIHGWHRGHTPLALRVHPLWNYVRNVVVESLLPGLPVPGGIVEEQCRDAADILTPWKFFGGPLAMVPNMIRIALDIRKWMDIGTIENHLVDEYWLIDAGPSQG